MLTLALFNNLKAKFLKVGQKVKTTLGLGDVVFQLPLILSFIDVSNGGTLTA
jgi:hypothetical protein